MSVRIGFFGCGGIAGAHFNALSQIPEAQPVAFCDIDPARAEAAAQRFGGRAYTDWQTMLEHEQLDALYVCVPPHAHVGAEEAAAERGIHLFVEKPVARTLEKAKAIEAAIAQAGVISSVGYHFRYMATTQKARELLEGKTVGMVTGWWMGGMPGVAWWRVMEQSGGQFVEQTTHIVDLARYLVDDIVEVYALMTNRKLHREVENYSVYDVGAVAVKFASGVIGAIHNTCLLNMGWRVGLEVVTPELIVETDWGKVKTTEPGKETVYQLSSNPYLEENKAFLHAIVTGDRSGIRSTYADAVKTLAVTLAANESAQTGQPVRVEA